MDLSHLKEEIMKAINLSPDFKEELIDIYENAVCEIEDGESEYHEVELALQEIKDLVG